MATLQQNMPIQLSMLSFFVVTGNVPSKYVGPAVAKLAEWSIPRVHGHCVCFQVNDGSKKWDFEIGDGI